MDPRCGPAAAPACALVQAARCPADVQTVREAVPSIDKDISALLFPRTSDASHPRGGSGSRVGSAGSVGRDENRAPNRAEQNGGSKSGGVSTRGGGGGGPGNGSALVLTEAEQHKVMRERMEELLQSINDTPRHCAPALVQLRKAVRAVPYEVWAVRSMCPTPPPICAFCTSLWGFVPLLRCECVRYFGKGICYSQVPRI